MLNWDFLAKYEMDLIKKTTDEVTERVTENVSKSIAKNVKGLLSNRQIAEATGLSIETVEKL